MKQKTPLFDLALVTDRRLRGGYRYRYEKGYREGSAEAAREAQTNASVAHAV